MDVHVDLSQYAHTFRINGVDGKTLPRYVVVNSCLRLWPVVVYGRGMLWSIVVRGGGQLWPVVVNSCQGCGQL